MRPADLKSSTNFDFSKKNNGKNLKFKIGDIVRISRHTSIFAKGYIPNWSEEHFMIEKVKNTVPWTYVIGDLKRKEIVGTFNEKELQKNKSKGV